MMTKFLLPLFLVLCTYSIAQAPYEDETRTNFNYRDYRFKVGLTDLFRGNLAFYYEQLLNDRMSIELGAGLTFDDFYGIAYWEGEQYVKRHKSEDMRYSFSLAVRFLPFRRWNFLFVGVGINHRRYYNADKDAYFHYERWVGSDRKEFSYKLETGCFFNFGKYFCIDYYIGYGLFTSYDQWNYVVYSPQGSPFKGGREAISRGSFFVGLRIGI